MGMGRTHAVEGEISATQKGKTMKTYEVYWSRHTGYGICPRAGFHQESQVPGFFHIVESLTLSLIGTNRAILPWIDSSLPFAFQFVIFCNILGERGKSWSKKQLF